MSWNILSQCESPYNHQHWTSFAALLPSHPNSGDYLRAWFSPSCKLYDHVNLFLEMHVQIYSLMSYSQECHISVSDKDWPEAETSAVCRLAPLHSHIKLCIDLQNRLIFYFYFFVISKFVQLSFIQCDYPFIRINRSLFGTIVNYSHHHQSCHFFLTSCCSLGCQSMCSF